MIHQRDYLRSAKREATVKMHVCLFRLKVTISIISNMVLVKRVICLPSIPSHHPPSPHPHPECVRMLVLVIYSLRSTSSNFAYLRCFTCNITYQLTVRLFFRWLNSFRIFTSLSLSPSASPPSLTLFASTAYSSSSLYFMQAMCVCVCVCWST